MITRDFKRFFANENADKIAELAANNGITLEINRYRAAYEERDSDRGYYYSISGTFADHHSFTLSDWNFRENDEGIKEFQPLPTFIEELKKKIGNIASGKDNIVRYVNNDPQQISDILHKMKGFMTALEDYQKGITINGGKHTMDIKVSSITLLNREESKTKAIATLVVNDEIAIHGIRVIEGKNGDFVQMPQKRDGYGNYSDIIFPVTAELREQINNAVLERYKNPISLDDLQLIGVYETKCDIPEADRFTMWDEISNSYAENPNVTISQLQAALIDAKQFAAAVKESEELSEAEQQQQEVVHSKIYASLHDVNNNKYLKAAGQIVIDDAIVITGVRVTEGIVCNTAEDGTKTEVTKTFVNMPSYQTETGDYNQYAHPITRACYDKINKCVMSAYENIGRFTYKGVKFAELGDKNDISSITDLNNKFAEKLMAELDKREIPYHAKIAETTTLSVKSSDKELVDGTRKELKNSLTPPKPKR